MIFYIRTHRTSFVCSFGTNCTCCYICTTNSSSSIRKIKITSLWCIIPSCKICFIINIWRHIIIYPCTWCSYCLSSRILYFKIDNNICIWCNIICITIVRIKCSILPSWPIIQRILTTGHTYSVIFCSCRYCSLIIIIYSITISISTIYLRLINCR